MNWLKASILILLTATVTLSCKKKHIEPEQPVQSTKGVTGKLYGKDFTVASGKANLRIIDFQEEGCEIFLSSGKNDGCGTVNDNFNVIIRIPRKVGKFTDYYAILSEPGTSNFSMFTDGNLFEITSISATTIKGYLKVTSATTNSSLEGVFEATICN